MKKTPTIEQLEWMEKNLKYNPWTGLVWNKRVTQPSTPPGHSKRYPKVRCEKVLYLAHRVIWFLQTGEWPDSDLVIDHINGVRNDNRWVNLRQVTVKENNINKHPSPSVFHLEKALGKAGIFFVHDHYKNYSQLVIEDKLTLLFTKDGEYMTVKE